MNIFRVDCDGRILGEFVNELAANDFASYLRGRDQYARVTVTAVPIFNPHDDQTSTRPDAWSTTRSPESHP